MADGNGTALVPFEKYELAQHDPAQVIEVVQANLGGQQMTERDLDVVKMPSGGSLFFEVPGLDGTQPEKTLQGVIVHQNIVRAFWKESIDEGGAGKPPDCHSPDAVWGFGDPGDGLRAQSPPKGCDDCPMSQFGSAEDGRGQACTQSHLLFLVRHEELLPMVVRLSPMSLAPAKKFLGRLSSKVIPYYGVVVEIGLEPAKNAEGTDYARATFRAAAVLEQGERERVKKFGDSLRPIFERTTAAMAAEGGAATEPDAVDAEPDAPAEG